MPIDRTRYPRHPDSRPIHLGIDDGAYVFAQDEAGIVHVLEDGPHRHPLILGEARPARFAGDLTIDQEDVTDITNLSGTFQFDSADGLIEVVRNLEDLGFTVRAGAVRLFPIDGSRPIVLR